MIDTKSRVLAITGSLVLLLFVIDLVRRRKLKEEYSVLWVAAAVTLLIMAAWYQLLGWITTAIGGVALSTTLFFFALLFVFFMLLHFSVRISAMERRMTALVQEAGLAAVTRPLPRLAGGSGPPAPHVAVVIPCHDDGPVLAEAVASALEQPEQPEVVVVDDGSSDPATLRTLDALPDAVTVVRQANAGPGAARTTGLERSHAPFVFVLDADDVLVPGALATMVERLERTPSAGFTWGDYEVFGDQHGRYRSPDAWLPWTLTYVNPYPVCSLFRRDVLVRAGGWMPRGYEDWDLWMALAERGIEGVRTDAVVYRRRILGAGRRIADLRARHQEHYARLRDRHPALFDRRAQLRAAERPALWKLATYPVLFGRRAVVPLRIELGLQRLMIRLGIGLPG